MRDVDRNDFPARSQTEEFSKSQAKTSAPKYLQQEHFDMNNPDHIRSGSLASICLSVSFSQRESGRRWVEVEKWVLLAASALV